MSRLTKQWTKLPPELVQQCLIKLSQLEDIEEELGIDLITLFKVLKNGIVFYGVIPVMVDGTQIKIDVENKQIRWNELKGFANISDYRKTWSLVRKELEK